MDKVSRYRCYSSGNNCMLQVLDGVLLDGKFYLAQGGETNRYSKLILAEMTDHYETEVEAKKVWYAEHIKYQENYIKELEETQADRAKNLAVSIKRLEQLKQQAG